MDTMDTIQCPYCGKEILAVAKKCKYCKEWIDNNKSVEFNETPKRETVKKKSVWAIVFGWKGWLIYILIFLLVKIIPILVKVKPNIASDNPPSLTNIETERPKRELTETDVRKNTMDFKASKENSIVTVGDVTLNFSSINTGQKWIFDNYPGLASDYYKYRDAERGDIYLLSKISISSRSKNPKLPPVSAYKLLNGSLSLIGTMEYEFSKWKSQESYLGFSSSYDYGNDFAHTETISFSCGLSISKDVMSKEVIFVVVKKINCFYRDDARRRSPPVAYVSNNCGIKSTLTIDDFKRDYVLVKIFNNEEISYNREPASSEPSEDFATFIKAFVSDEKFQLEHIKFPLSTMQSKDDWNFLDSDIIFEGIKTIDGEKYQGGFDKMSNNEYVYGLGWPESELFLRILFTKINGQWLLTEYQEVDYGD